MTLAPREIVQAPAREWRAYPEYRDSGVEWIGEIPEHWQVKRLKYVVAMNSDVLTEDMDPDLVLSYVDIGNIDSTGTVLGAEEIRFEDAPSRARRRVKDGDTIISTVRTYLWAIAYIEEPPENLIVSTGFAVLRPDTELDPKFLFRMVQSNEFVEMVVSASEGVGYPAITPTRLVDLPVWVLPLLEQGAIATFLDRETEKIDALITKRERLIELLEEKRTALIGRAVTKGLDPDVPVKDSGVEWLGEIPEHWEVKRLKHVTSLITSGSRDWSQYYSDEGAVFLRIGNLPRTSINLKLDDVQYVDLPDSIEGKRTLVKENDLLLSITAFIGSVAVAPDIGEAYVNQHVALARPRRDVVNERWVAYSLFSRAGQSQFRLSLYGGTKDGLALDDVKGLIVATPPLHEQDIIANYLDRETNKVDALVNKVQEHIEKLREYRTALISAAVTGKIDVRGEVV